MGPEDRVELQFLNRAPAVKAYWGKKHWTSLRGSNRTLAFQGGDESWQMDTAQTLVFRVWSSPTGLKCNDEKERDGFKRLAPTDKVGTLQQQMSVTHRIPEAFAISRHVLPNPSFRHHIRLSEGFIYLPGRKDEPSTKDGPERVDDWLALWVITLRQGKYTSSYNSLPGLSSSCPNCTFISCFPSLPHFPPLLLILWITFQINNLHSKSCLSICFWGNPN